MSELRLWRPNALSAKRELSVEVTVEVEEAAVSVDAEAIEEAIVPSGAKGEAMLQREPKNLLKSNAHKPV